MERIYFEKGECVACYISKHKECKKVAFIGMKSKQVECGCGCKASKEVSK